MKSQEVRLGNYHFYHIVDKYDERGEYDEVCQIDAEDFRILENFDCPEYKPIPLDEEWLLKLGFFVGSKKNCYYKDWAMNGVETIVFEYHYKGGYDYEVGANRYKTIHYVHQLQNLYFALTGEELEIKEK